MDEDKIKKQAKQILDKFAKALENVKDIEEYYIERDVFEREEGEGEVCDFKKELLRNALNHDDDFIIAEKGDWK